VFGAFFNGIFEVNAESGIVLGLNVSEFELKVRAVELKFAPSPNDNVDGFNTTLSSDISVFVPINESEQDNEFNCVFPEQVNVFNSVLPEQINELFNRVLPEQVNVFN
jgi:hypothetical protein